MADWIDRNFEVLAAMGFLKRARGSRYSITDKGAAQAVRILQTAGCLDFHAFHTEQDFATAHTMLKEAAKRWMAGEGGSPGTRNHILIDCFSGALS